MKKLLVLSVFVLSLFGCNAEHSDTIQNAQLIILLIVVGFAYYLYIQIESLKSDIKNLKRKVDTKNTKNDIVWKTTVENKMNQISKELKDIQAELTELKKRLNSKPPESDESENDEPEKEPDVIYFRFKNNTELQQQVSNEQDAEFKVFNIENNQASFEYCGSVKNPEYFRHVCSFDKNPFSIDSPNKVITTQPGIVKLENEKWIVTKKAKIKFI